MTALHYRAFSALLCYPEQELIELCLKSKMH